ncbi:hypothetical protein INR49_022700 [Caranx melampygus]|nr:hypothetical protein INR49_022700 [Caranx melampygus]
MLVCYGILFFIIAIACRCLTKPSAILLPCSRGFGIDSNLFGMSRYLPANFLRHRPSGHTPSCASSHRCISPNFLNNTRLAMLMTETLYQWMAILAGMLTIAAGVPSVPRRVELVDPEMKNNNVTVIMKNVTHEDTGVYECHISSGTIKTFNLTVSDHTGGGEEEGGDLRNKDEGNTTGQYVNGAEI